MTPSVERDAGLPVSHDLTLAYILSLLSALLMTVASAAGATFFSFLLGVVGVNMSGFVDAPQFQEWATRMGIRNAGDAFLFLIMYVLGQVVSVYAITVALRLRSEEVEGRADPVLATPVSRLNWASSHLFFAAFNSAVLLVVLGLALGLVGLRRRDVG